MRLLLVPLLLSVVANSSPADDHSFPQWYDTGEVSDGAIIGAINRATLDLHPGQVVVGFIHLGKVLEFFDHRIKEEKFKEDAMFAVEEFLHQQQEDSKDEKPDMIAYGLVGEEYNRGVKFSMMTGALLRFMVKSAGDPHDLEALKKLLGVSFQSWNQASNWRSLMMHLVGESNEGIVRICDRWQDIVRPRIIKTIAQSEHAPIEALIDPRWKKPKSTLSYTFRVAMSLRGHHVIDWREDHFLDHVDLYSDHMAKDDKQIHASPVARGRPRTHEGQKKDPEEEGKLQRIRVLVSQLQDEWKNCETERRNHRRKATAEDDMLHRAVMVMKTRKLNGLLPIVVKARRRKAAKLLLAIVKHKIRSLDGIAEEMECRNAVI